MPNAEINNIKIWGQPLEDAVAQMAVCSRTAQGCALMADHHLGYSMPVGGVCLYEEHISPSGVGYDIGCGNKAVRLDIKLKDIQSNLPEIMDQIFSQIGFGVGQPNNQKVDSELFDSDSWKFGPQKGLKDLAREQLGTVGGGNHYVDVFADEIDRIWIGVHFGSRGLGHKIASHYIQAGGGKDAIHAPPVLFELKSELGQEYLHGMELAGQYAYAGRDWVCSKVAEIIGAKIIEEVHNHHNYAWQETHFGKDFWVVRKGATPAFPQQKGFVGASMGEDSYIIEGIESEEAKQSFYSTVHGAGRVMSRTKAAGKVRWKNGRRVQVSQGEVSKEMMNSWIKKAGVALRGAGLDESPDCYKRLEQVLKFHSEYIKIIHTLRPLGVAMAGETIFDPYKD